MTGVEALMATKIAGDLTLGTALTVGGLAISAGSAVIGGIQQGKMADYNARVAENAAIASRQQAQVQIQNLRRRQSKLNSSQIAATAGSGIVAEGSPILVMADSAAEAEYDAELIRYGGEVQAAQAFSQAALDRMQARSARLGGALGGAGSLLLAGGVLGGGFGGGKTVIGNDASLAPNLATPPTSASA